MPKQFSDVLEKILGAIMEKREFHRSVTAQFLPLHDIIRGQTTFYKWYICLFLSSIASRLFLMYLFCWWVINCING